MPNVRRIKIDVPSNSILSKYEEQLCSIIKNDEDKDTISFRRQVFNDCLTFVKRELKAENFPLVMPVFVNSQSEYEILEKRPDKYTTESVKTMSLAFTTPSTFFMIIYLNMEQFFNLLKISKQTFVYHLVEIYIHELLHCYYGLSKNEQEIHITACEMFEKFSGLKLPDEIKKMRMSDFYESR